MGKSKEKNNTKEEWKYYKEIVDYANSIILRFNISGEIIFINKYAQKFFGYKEEEILGKNLFGTILSETDSSGNNLKEMINNIIHYPDRFINNQNENITKEGKKVWINWTNRPIRDENNQVREIISIGNDLTYTRQIMLRLEESEKKFRELANNLEQCIWIKRADNKEAGKFDFISPAFEKIFGISLHNNYFNFKDLKPIIFPEDRDWATEAMKNNFEKGFDIEFRIKRPDGNMAWIWYRSIPIKNDEGKTIKLVGIIQDITFRKMAELEYLRIIEKK